MAKIIDIKGREILDSRGFPTVEAEVALDDGAVGIAAAPSGASTGSKEAVERRDNDHRFAGKGVLGAVDAVNNPIREAMLGQAAGNQRTIDDTLISLDGTPTKSNLGANAILSVSLAACRAEAASRKMPLYLYLAELSQGCGRQPVLPVPLVNVINGGSHADNNLEIQEFMLVPAGAGDFAEAIRWSSEIFHALRSILAAKGCSCNVGDEGGFAPELRNADEACQVICDAIRQTGLAAGKDVFLALDCASNEYYRDAKYILPSAGAEMTSDEHLEFLQGLCRNYPIISIEDPMHEDDRAGWQAITERLGDKLQLVGDDLFVTNTKILAQGIEQGLANAILIKPNQIGTLSESFDAIAMAKDGGYSYIISHRSGETEDSSIADIAVAMGAGQIKTGSVTRGERVAKYNRLLRIAESAGSDLVYQGLAAFGGRLGTSSN